jgi:hypothetical protein
MVVDARRDGRMGDLEEERSRTRAQEEQRLAVEPPGFRVGAVQAGEVRSAPVRGAPPRGPGVTDVVDPSVRRDRTHRCTIPTITEGRGR